MFEPERMASPQGKQTSTHVAKFKFATRDAGRELSEQLVVFSGHVLWSRASELRVFRRNDVVAVCFTSRVGDPADEFGRWQRQEGLFDFLERSVPVLLAFILTILNVFSVTVLLSLVLASFLWQVFPDSGAGYDMSRGPDYRPLAGSAACAVFAGLTALLCLKWLETPALEFLGAQPGNRQRKRWLQQANRFVLGLYAIWCLYVLIVCPVAYSITWKLDCSTDICEPDATGVATCGVHGCACSSFMDMSCTPVVSKEMGGRGLCASLEQPFCGASRSGAQGPLLAAALGSSVLPGLQIYGSWVLDAGRRSQKTKVPYHRFKVTFRGDEPLVFTLGPEDPQEVIDALMPAADLGDPLFYGAPTDTASTGVPDEEQEPQWC
ncbi:unnamed protein product [Effrenium voratum]|nr:unnamed protein product [Effrenium voratum]